MKYLSVCSGIEAATVAWEPLGWEPVGFSEIEPFPAAVLNHRFPGVKNYGDMTKFKEWNIERGSIDLLVGGTPCQSFSIAGLRKGLTDPRGNLMLTYGAIADHLRPRWIVWENVPGVLSSFSGENPPSELQPGQTWETTETSDFGGFLSMLAELGYGFAYRILDAQYIRVESHERAVPQRRRRIFVVGYLGDWRRAAAVLFESESLRRNTPPSRKAGERVAGCLTTGFGSRGIDSDQIANGNYQVSHTLNAHGGSGRLDYESETFIPSVSGTLQNNGKAAGSATQQDAENGMLVTQEVSPALRAQENTSNRLDSMAVVAFAQNSRDELREMEVPGALAAKPGMKQTSYLRQGLRVRRLTPKECSRLQGFPDNWAKIPWKGKPAEQCPDGPQYKSYGNSIAVNVMRWIGERIS